MPKTLITGAAAGIGRATAELLAKRGHELLLVDRAELPFHAGQGLTLLRGDVASEAFWQEIAPQLEGMTHALVNAGISGGGEIATLDFSEWRRVLAVNLDGAFLSLRAALRALTRSTGPRAVVVSGSVSGSKAEAGTAAYASSKAGVAQLARVAAREVAAEGIRVNIIAPGGVDTTMWDKMPFFQEMVVSNGGRDAALAAMAKMATPLGRFASAEEIAEQIAFLLSNEAATITGAILTSDGGYSL